MGAPDWGGTLKCGALTRRRYNFTPCSGVSSERRKLDSVAWKNIERGEKKFVRHSYEMPLQTMRRYGFAGAAKSRLTPHSAFNLAPIWASRIDRNNQRRVGPRARSPTA